jgi:hypothetical protein
VGHGELGLKYRYQRFGLRNTVERFFEYLKQRTGRFYNDINTWRIKSIEDYASAIAIIRNILTIIKPKEAYYFVDRITLEGKTFIFLRCGSL